MRWCESAAFAPVIVAICKDFENLAQRVME